MARKSGSFKIKEHRDDRGALLLSELRERGENVEYLEATDPPSTAHEKVTNDHIQKALEESMNGSEDTSSDPEDDGNSQPNSTEDLHRPANPRRTNYSSSCAVLASINSVLLGVYIKMMSGAAAHVKQDLTLTDTSIEALTGIFNLFTFLGSVMAGATAYCKGRRITIVMSGAILFFTPLLTSFAPSYGLFVTGHFIAHLGVGCVLTITPVYIVEVAPAISRGCLTSLPEVFVNVGILLGYIINYALSKLHLNLRWHIIISGGATGLVLLTINVLDIPESPQWLIMQGRFVDAERVLTKIYDSDEEAAIRLNEIKKAASIPEKSNEDIANVKQPGMWEVMWRDLFLHPTPSMCHILICVIMIQFFQQVCSIDTILLLFKKADIIPSRSNKLLMTLGVDLVKTIFIPLATVLLDRVGRRPLLLYSTRGMIFSLFLLGTCLTVLEQSDKEPTWAVNLCIFSVFCHVCFFSIGLGPVTSVYSSEVFPMRMRAQGYVIGIAVSQLMSTVISITFLPLYRAITLGGVAFLLLTIMISALVFISKLMPETQKKTLEEMGRFFGKFTKWNFAREIELKRATSRSRQRGEANGKAFFFLGL